MKQRNKVYDYTAARCKASRNAPDAIILIQYFLWAGSQVVYNDAAASTMPAPLNSFGLVTTISTGYFHVMYFVQPALVSVVPPTVFPRVTQCAFRRLTPIRALPSKVLPHIRHHHHSQQQLNLLQALPPFLLGVAHVFVIARLGARVGGGQRVDVVVVGGAGGGFVETFAVGQGHGGYRKRIGPRRTGDVNDEDGGAR
jgi:hypothetical protein